MSLDFINFFQWILWGFHMPEPNSKTRRTKAKCKIFMQSKCIVPQVRLIKPRFLGTVCMLIIEFRENLFLHGSLSIFDVELETRVCWKYSNDFIEKHPIIYIGYCKPLIMYFVLKFAYELKHLSIRLHKIKYKKKLRVQWYWCDF